MGKQEPPPATQSEKAELDYVNCNSTVNIAPFKQPPGR